MSDENPIKRWTAKRKATVVMDIFKASPTKSAVIHLLIGQPITLGENRSINTA